MLSLSNHDQHLRASVRFAAIPVDNLYLANYGPYCGRIVFILVRQAHPIHEWTRIYHALSSLSSVGNGIWYFSVWLLNFLILAKVRYCDVERTISSEVLNLLCAVGSFACFLLLVSDNCVKNFSAATSVFVIQFFIL
jgi:hypothetical protein